MQHVAGGILTTFKCCSKCLISLLTLAFLEACGQRAPQPRFLLGRRLTACPTFARLPLADTNGDCVCPLHKSVCYENGVPWCTRNNGLRDYHYFSMTCQVCSCHQQGTAPTPGSATQLGQCKADGVYSSLMPDANGICKCPPAKPVCVTRSGVQESVGCRLPTASGGGLDNHRFAADCSDCACREVCPAQARSYHADSFGDCACSNQLPVCYENGVKGCGANSALQGIQNTYFRSSCGSQCVCRVDLGNCEPRTCLTTADCSYSQCSDCQMCLSITRCLQSGVKSILPNTDGNCECSGQLSCFQPGSSLPLCPVAPFGSSSVKFRSSCVACQCRALSSVTTVQCPSFAASLQPDRYADCACPQSALDCYENNGRWCTRTDLRRDLHYFSVGCTTCECRPANPNSNFQRQMPCPSYARYAISDVYRNCQCPLARPLCVEGTYSSTSAPTTTVGSSAAAVSPSRTGPLCNTTYGWLSATTFRYDCGSQCDCIEVLGEGSRLRSIRPDELVNRTEGSYMKQYMIMDIRVVNSLDTITDWAQAHDDVTNKANLSYVAGVVGGLQTILPAAAFIQDIKILSTKDYAEPNMEMVRAMRLHVDFGVMWIDQNNNLIPVAQLSARETNLLLNFASIFNDRDLKVEYEIHINDFMNKTWEDRKALILNSSATAVRILAPAVQAVRVVINSNPTVGLSLTGPLAPNPPVLRSINRGDKVTKEESDSTIIIFAVVGALSICYSLPCCYFVCKRLRKCCNKWRQMRDQRRATALAKTQRGASGPVSPRTGQLSPKGADAAKGARGSGPKAKGMNKYGATAPRSMMDAGPRTTAIGSPRSQGSARKASTQLDENARKAEEAQMKREHEEQEKQKKKLIKRMGDLAGFKSLSTAARKALQAEFDSKHHAGEKGDKKGVFGRRDGANTKGGADKEDKKHEEVAAKRGMFMSKFRGGAPQKGKGDLRRSKSSQSTVSRHRSSQSSTSHDTSEPPESEEA